MRFIAVFNQFQDAKGVGFDNLRDAVDFLFWGYEDHELLPMGVYDSVTRKATPYDHAGQTVGLFSQESIRQIAAEYLVSISQFAMSGRRITIHSRILFKIPHQPNVPYGTQNESNHQ